MRNRDADIANYGLNSVMEFDHVICVHEDGTVTDAPDELYAPEFYGDSATGECGLEQVTDAWSNFGGRYTSQQGVHDLLHNCESIGAGLERDILANPGYYVAVYCTWTPDPETCDCGDVEDCQCDNVEGWTVAFREAS